MEFSELASWLDEGKKSVPSLQRLLSFVDSYFTDDECAALSCGKNCPNSGEVSMQQDGIDLEHSEILCPQR